MAKKQRVCPWWGGYFIDNPLRRLLHNPEKILAPYVEPGMRTLDFGCGMGFFSIAMAKLTGEDGQVIAADLQPQMLVRVQFRAGRAGVGSRVQTQQCGKDAIGLDAPIDFALAFWSAHEAAKMENLLQEVHAHLAPQGKFLVIEPKGHVPQEDFDAMVAIAYNTGFEAAPGPAARFSQSVAFTKTSGAET